MKDNIQLLQAFLLEELTIQQKEKIKQLEKIDPEFKQQYQLIVALKKAVKLNILNDKVKYLEHVENTLPQLQTYLKNEKLSIERLIDKIRKQFNVLIYLFEVNLIESFFLNMKKVV